MGQGTETYKSERNLERDKTDERKKDESVTGRDIPGGDGTVGDEQVDAIDKDTSEIPIGQDQSTKRLGIHDPDHGVGEIQDREDTGSDIAHIRD
jgi:hypothetical protein